MLNFCYPPKANSLCFCLRVADAVTVFRFCHFFLNHYRGTYYNNQNQIWCVNMGVYMFFGSILGSDYYGMVCPPVTVLDIVSKVPIYRKSNFRYISYRTWFALHPQAFPSFACRYWDQSFHVAWYQISNTLVFLFIGFVSNSIPISISKTLWLSLSISNALWLQLSITNALRLSLSISNTLIFGAVNGLTNRQVRTRSTTTSIIVRRMYVVGVGAEALALHVSQITYNTSHTSAIIPAAASSWHRCCNYRHFNKHTHTFMRCIYPLKRPKGVAVN